MSQLNFGKRCCPKVANKSSLVIALGKQWTKEGKRAIKSRLSCRSFVANDMCIQMHVLAYNIGKFPRTLATSETMKDLSLTILRGRDLTAFIRRHPAIDRRTRPPPEVVIRSM